MPVDPALRGKFRAQIAKDYEAHTLRAGNAMPEVRRLPSRSLGLDYIMARGYPFGRMSRAWGGFSTCKSLSIWNAFYSAQHYPELRARELERLALMAEQDMNLRESKAFKSEAKRALQTEPLRCLYVAAEKIYDDIYVNDLLGVRTGEDDLEIVFSTRIEEIGDIVQNALGAYHVIAIDSTTDTISIDELNNDDGLFAPDYGLHRIKKWGRNLAWFLDRISPDNVLIYASQIQSKIGMSARQRIEGEKAPGGNKMEHDSSMTLHYMKGGWLKRKDGGGLQPVGDKGGEKGAFGKAQAAGMEVVVRCDKNKQGPSHRVALLHHDKLTGNFDSLWELERFAKYFKVVTPTSAGSTWYLLPSGEKVQSLRPRLEEDVELVRQVEAVVYRCAADPRYEQQLLRSKGGPGELLVPALEE